MFRKLLGRKRETRSAGFTDLVLRGIDATVEGADVDALVTGAVEIAAGTWARALAAARVEGTDLLTSRLRHRIGRDLIRQGESVVEIVSGGDGLALRHAFAWDVLEDFRYRLDIPMPKGKTLQRTVPRDAVLHFTWSVDPREPWAGVSPLESATSLRKIAARIEDRMGQDLATPVAHLVPIPTDGGDTNLDSLRGDIGKAKGNAVLVEATSQGWEDKGERGTRHDWKAERLGPEVPTELRHAWRDILDAVGTACGIPAALTHQDADGTAQREAYRRFVMSAVEPIADMIAETASEGLEAGISLHFDSLWAHDLAGRAAAYQKLRAGDMPDADARRIAGIG